MKERREEIEKKMRGGGNYIINKTYPEREKHIIADRRDQLYIKNERRERWMEIELGDRIIQTNKRDNKKNKFEKNSN